MSTTGKIIATATSVTALAAIAITARVWISPALAAPEYRTAEELNRTCYSSNDTITCSLTNRSARGAYTCMRATLKNTKTGAIAEPVSFCSGTIAPYETKTLTAQWASFAAKLCPVEGMKNLANWEDCSFETSGFDPR